MNKKRAAERNFQCRTCDEALHKIGSEYGCLNEECFDNFHAVAYRVQLGLIPKNRL